MKSTREPFEVNTTAVVAFKGVICGFNAMKDGCNLMNIPNSMSKCTYTTRQADIHSAITDAAAKMAEKSVCAIKSAYHNTGFVENKDGIVDIAVSFDGTWHRRGFLATLELHQ